MIIESNGHQVEIFEFGAGTETLLMAAGNARPAAQLEALALGLAAQGLRVVTYNYRGIGASTGSLEGLSLLDHAADLWGIADALGLDTVHLAGKTFGNRVVRAASQSRPERVRSITLIGAGGNVEPTPETRALMQRQQDPAISQEEWVRLQGILMYAPGKEHLAALDLQQGTWPVLAAAQSRSSAATPVADWQGGGTAPMLILAGLLDRVAPPESGLSIARSRPGTWYVGIPDCGHNMLRECHDDLVRLMSDFINRVLAMRRG